MIIPKSLHTQISHTIKIKNQNTKTNTNVMKRHISLFILFSLCSITMYAQQTVAGWYNYTDYVAEPGARNIGFLVKDSAAKVLIQNQQFNTMAMDQYVGSIYSPSESLIDYSINPQLKVASSSNTKLDTIGFAYGYVRNTQTNVLNNNSPVFDTLIITWFNHQHLFQRYSNVSGNIQNLPLPIPAWDKYKREHNNYFKKDTIILDDSYATQVFNNNGSYENSWQTSMIYFKAPDGLISDSTDHSKLFGYALQFRSGVIGGDTGFMVYQRPPSTLPAGAIRPNYFIYPYINEPGINIWQGMSVAAYGQISVPGTFAYPNTTGTGFISGNMYTQKRLMVDEVHFTSTVPANPVNIKLECTPEYCALPTKGSIKVFVTGGVSPYQYSLDGINYQGSNIFMDLPAGMYNVYVKYSNNQVRLAKTKIIKVKGNESGMVRGPGKVRKNEITTYDSPNTPLNYRWFVEGGVINNSVIDLSISVTWGNQVGKGKVGLISNPNTPCADTTVFEVDILYAVGLSDNSAMDDIKMYPNPALNLITLDGLDYKSYQVTVADINGKILIKNDVTSTNQHLLNIEELAKGYYIITLTKNDSVKHLKLVKQ